MLAMQNQCSAVAQVQVQVQVQVLYLQGGVECQVLASGSPERLSGKPERQGVTDGPWKMEPRSPIEALQGTW